jgi:hypothetical protein
MSIVMTLVRSRDSGDPDVIDFMTVGAVWMTVSPVEACTLRFCPQAYLLHSVVHVLCTCTGGAM